MYIYTKIHSENVCIYNIHCACVNIFINTLCICVLKYIMYNYAVKKVYINTLNTFMFRWDFMTQKIFLKLFNLVDK